MNKKMVLTAILIIAVVIFAINSKRGDTSDISNDYQLKTYDSDIVCSLKFDATDEDDAYTSYVYIYNDGDYVKEAIFQTITYTDFTGSYVGLMNSFYDMYKELEGVETSIFEGNDFVVSTIKYNYLNMEPSIIKDNLKTILEDDSILLYDNYKFKTDWYIDDYLDEYTCEVK